METPDNGAKRDVQRTVRILTRVAWGVLIAARGLVLIAPGLPVVVALLYFASLVGLVWLLVVYRRPLGQWKAVAAAWLAYCLLRWLVTRLPLADASFLAQNAAALASVLVVDTLLAGYAALISLAIRRDVSVAYIGLATFAAGLALLGQVRLSGGVLNMLLGLAATEMQAGFTAVEPLLMAGSCMLTLGLVSFLPHLFCLFVREMRGR